MYLSELLVCNYRSCKNLSITLFKDDPNIFIGINDCGKTTLLKAMGLLLEEKPVYNFIKDNSSKKDFSNSPISQEEFNLILTSRGLPVLPYTSNQTVIGGKFILEDSDIDNENLPIYSEQLLWSIEKSNDSCIWLVRVFESNSPSYSTYLLTKDSSQEITPNSIELWNKSQADLNKLIKELNISKEEIENVNKVGRFSNLEKIMAIYNKLNVESIWRAFKIEKGDKTIFPVFRYLDWNCSLEDIKKTATDAMAAKIESHLKPLRTQANSAAQEVEYEINEQLKDLKNIIGDVLPNITGIKTKVYIDVKETVTDILINKNNCDGDIHLDLQGEGVKRQIWFALIKSGALASISTEIKNKKFIWAFDEPETHLFPSAQRQFFDIIKKVSLSNVQTLISTHSTVFIDKSKLNTIRSVSLNEDSYSEYFECTSVDEIFNSLELRNSDFLFYDKFLVIEGDTESYFIPPLFKLYTGHSLEEDNIQLINLTGKNKWLEGKQALEKVLKGFKKSFEYVIYLFDNDMSFELGAVAKTDKMFFIGKQDVEDSIENEVWINFVKESTQGEIDLTNEEIQALKDQISDNNIINSEQKFYKVLEKLVKQKLVAKTGEEVTWTVLPSKGNELAQLLLKNIDDINKVSNRVKDAFDKIIQ